tara:strand:+ start:238 stop:792 length:555 start_codon:yes stop_codon:yes gene_type:complete
VIAQPGFIEAIMGPVFSMGPAATMVIAMKTSPYAKPLNALIHVKMLAMPTKTVPSSLIYPLNVNVQPALKILMKTALVRSRALIHPAPKMLLVTISAVRPPVFVTWVLLAMVRVAPILTAAKTILVMTMRSALIFPHPIAVIFANVPQGINPQTIRIASWPSVPVMLKAPLIANAKKTWVTMVN